MRHDSDVSAFLDKAQSERVVFSCKVIKFNRFGMQQERTLLLTNLYLCNLKKKNPQRKIPVAKIRGATKSTVEKAFEFIIHVSKEYDYRFVSKDRDDFFKALKKVFFDYHHHNLPIYGVPHTKLKDYATGKKDMKKGIEIIPEENYRLHHEDIYESQEKPSGLKPLNSSAY